MDMICLRNISVDTLHKGDTVDNNNKICVSETQNFVMLKHVVLIIVIVH